MSKNYPKLETTTLWDFPIQNYGDRVQIINIVVLPQHLL